MAFAAAICRPIIPSLSSISIHPNSQTNPTTFFVSEHSSSPCSSSKPAYSSRHYCSSFSRISYRFSSGAEDDYDDIGDEEEEEDNDCSFDEAVVLFNRREYYKCHDFLESLWNKAEEPRRTLFHGILQCAVGFHHLFNQNHKGAMMELGEGLCKLRKMNFKSGPFNEFEQEISAALEFIYQTQIELAACGDNVCVAMDRSERSYQLLGRYAEGQMLYTLQLQVDDASVYIVFNPQGSYTGDPPKVKLPMLNATEQHLM